MLIKELIFLEGKKTLFRIYEIVGEEEFVIKEEIESKEEVISFMRDYMRGIEDKKRSVRAESYDVELSEENEFGDFDL